MPVPLNKITIQNKSGLDTTFQIKAPAKAKDSSKTIGGGKQDTMQISVEDVDTLTIKASDGTHDLTQTISVKTTESGYRHYIYDATIAYAIGEFTGEVRARTDKWG